MPLQPRALRFSAAVLTLLSHTRAGFGVRCVHGAHKKRSVQHCQADYAQVRTDGHDVGKEEENADVEGVQRERSVKARGSGRTEYCARTVR